MLKLSQLLTNIELFSKRAVWGYRLVRAARENKDYLSDLETYDIRNEELFEQFEQFTDSYKEFIELYSQLSSQKLNDDTITDIGDVIRVLKKRAEKILNNNYLNVTEEGGYDEDFKPGDLTKTVLNVLDDAANKFQEALGEEISVLEMPSPGVAREFSDHQERYMNSGKQEEYSAYKTEKQKEYAKKRQEMISFLGKHNPQHEMYQSYILSRNRSYQNIMSDEGRKTRYRDKARERQAQYTKKLDSREKELLRLIPLTRSPEKLAELQAELQSIQRVITKRKTRWEEEGKKIKNKKESKTLEGYIIHLSQKIASFKKDKKVSIKNSAKTDPYFIPFKAAVKAAKEKVDMDNSPINQTALAAAIEQENEALQSWLINHKEIKKIVEDLTVIYAYRDKLQELNKTDWMSLDSIPEEVKPHIASLIEEGQALINKFKSVYKTPMQTVKDIIDLLSAKL